jgi:predicted RNase H-like HicB family nuclease
MSSDLKTYIGIIEREGLGFSIFFPEFPVCFARGPNLKVLRRNAARALGRYLELSRPAHDGVDHEVDLTSHNPWSQSIGRMLICPLLG